MPVGLWVTHAVLCSLTYCHTWRMLFGSEQTSEQLSSTTPFNTRFQKPKNASGLGFKEVAVADHLLEEVNGMWYVRVNNRSRDLIHMKGDGRGLLWGVLHGRTDTGKWYTFRDPPAAFKEYLFNRPIKLKRNRVVYDGTHWYIRDRLKKWRRLIWRGVKDWGDVVYARADDNVWYKFVNTSEMELVCNHIRKLPPYEVTQPPPGQNPIMDTRQAIEQLRRDCALELRAQATMLP